MAQLYDWQKPSAEKLEGIFRSGGLIGLNSSDTGTGKTFVALDVLRRLDRRALVLCPKSARTNWRRAAEAMGVADRLMDVHNPERIKTGKTRWWSEDKWRFPVDALLVWDEIHKGTSGIDTDTGRMLAYTKAYRIPVLGLSATLADTPLKLQALGYLLDLHGYNKASFYEWCRRHGCYRSTFHRGLEFPKGPSGRAHMRRIQEAIADRMVRLRIDDVPEFPEGVLECNLYDLDERATEEINAIWASMPEEVRKGGDTPLTENLRARQQTELLKVPLLTELTSGILDEDKSVVVFVNFRETLTRIEEALKAKGVEGIVKIFGGQKDAERQAAQDMFQANLSSVCLCMIQAGGISINLHDVKRERPRVSLISPSWSAQEVVQSLGRIHRAGGSKALQIFVLAAGTVEEKVHAAIQRKLANIRALVDSDLVL